MEISKNSPKQPIRPYQALILGFLAVILVGTLLLLLPISTAEGNHTSLVDALFTATSAVCVTGLIVVDTASHWSDFGHVVIMCLIQIGGLGIMTMSTAIALLLGRRISFRERLLIKESLGTVSLEGLVRLVRIILMFTITFVLSATVLLTIRWSAEYSIGQAAWLGLFHSVSAFNNAGFDIFGTSLMNYVNDPIVNAIFVFLIISGGLGFTVLAEIYKRTTTPNERGRFTLHTKVVAGVTLTLLLVGTLFIFAAEFNNSDTMGNLQWYEKLLASFFTAVTPRTAGFNTLPTGALRHSSLFFIVMLMFIGGSAGSTAGGVKTTTFFALVATVINTCRGNSRVQVFDRSLKWDTIRASMSIVSLALILVFAVTLLLLTLEGAPLVDCLFEAMSAFGTVGLSTGLTPDLSIPGRLLITFTMFVGRLGPLTLALAFAGPDYQGNKYNYPKESIMIG